LLEKFCGVARPLKCPCSELLKYGVDSRHCPRTEGHQKNLKPTPELKTMTKSRRKITEIALVLVE
jgi:hypothetical protein